MYKDLLKITCHIRLEFMNWNSCPVLRLIKFAVQLDPTLSENCGEGKEQNLGLALQKITAFNMSLLNTMENTQDS